MNEPSVIIQTIATESNQLAGIITLNNPKSLNSLTLDMINTIHEALTKWVNEDKITFIILKSAHKKAFCAGGDIRELYESILQNNYGKNSYAELFFSKEYRLDYCIHRYPKPIICLGTGIVMGGGIGLMCGASHRIVDDSSILSMPEIRIGLFPDVGGSWFLSKMPTGIGHFIGLTGVKMNAGDALFTKLADYYLPTDHLDTIEKNLLELSWQSSTINNHQLLSDFLKQLSKPHLNNIPKSLLTEYSNNIKDIIQPTPDKTLQKMLNSEIEWLQKNAKTLQNGCPISAWIIFEQIKRAKKLSLANIFSMEMDIAIQCTRHKDFCEGIRALLIDRDNKPKWEDSLDTVPQEKINNFFTSPWSQEKHPLNNLPK